MTALKNTIKLNVNRTNGQIHFIPSNTD